MISAIFSFFVWGGGQLYNGELRKAIVFFSAELVSILYFWDFFREYLVFQVVSGWIGITAYQLVLFVYALFSLFVWALCIYDAYTTASFLDFIRYREMVNSADNGKSSLWDLAPAETTSRPWGMVLLYSIVVLFLARYVMSGLNSSEFHVLTERIRQQPHNIEHRFALVRYYVQNQQIRHAIPELEDYKIKYGATLTPDLKQKLDELLNSLTATETRAATETSTATETSHNFVTTGVLQNTKASEKPTEVKILPEASSFYRQRTEADWLDLRRQTGAEKFAALGDQYLADQGTDVSLVKILLADAFRQEKWSRIRELASVGLRIEPHNPSLLESLAIAEEQIYRQTTNSTTSIAPTVSAGAVLNLGELLTEAGHLFNQNQDAQALEVLEKYFAGGGTHRDAFHLQYSIYSRSNNTDAAILCLIQALKQEPGDERALENLARIYFRQGDYGLAARYFQELSSLNPNATNFKNAGIALKRFGKPQEAIESYRLGLQADPNDETIVFLLAFILLENNEIAESIKLYEKLQVLNPAYPLLDYYYGQALEADQDFPAAVGAYRRLSPDSPVYQKAQDRIKVLSPLLSITTQVNPTLPASPLAPASTALNPTPSLVTPPQVVQTSLVAPSLVAPSLVAQTPLAKPVSSTPSANSGASAISSGVGNKPDTITAIAPLLEAAERAYQKNDWSLSQEYYQRVLAIDPLNVYALTQVGRIYFAYENQYEKAYSYLSRALQLNPDSVWLNLAVGIIEKAFNNTDAAIGYFQKALTIDPTHLNANFNLALIYEERNQIEKAKDHYMSVIINHPGHQLAYNYLGDIYFNEGDYFKAQDMYREILSKAPNNIGIRLKLAICLEKISDLSGALREYERLLPLVAGQEFIEQEVSNSIERLKKQSR